jgi:hypothetical protein
MKHINEMVDEYVRDSGLARREMRDGQAGVMFFDEMEWMPLTDLGYNKDFGFYRISQLPGVTNEAKGYE